VSQLQYIDYGTDGAVVPIPSTLSLMICTEYCNSDNFAFDDVS
jgi:hypothetical protein